MKKKLLSLLLLVCVACSALTGCLLDPNADSTTSSPSSSESTTPPQLVDYVSQVSLNRSSGTPQIEIIPGSTDKNFTHIDGDTTHFSVPKSFDDTGTMKVRYMGIDTPESTGDIEEWGKAASNHTKASLSNASSIVIEANEDHWTRDTNQRYLGWVWYKTKGSDSYRLLNLELLQMGLAVESKTSEARYGTICSQAAEQARLHELYIYSDEKDPDFYYGAAIQTTLKEVRMNLDDYVGKRVAIHGVVSIYKSKGSIYVEDYDEDENRSYGIPVFYGLGNIQLDPILAPGNEVRIVGEVTKSDTFGYQISGLYYDFMDPDNEESVKMFSSNNSVVAPETTVDTFVANDYAFAKAALYSSVTVNNLLVKKVYTTNNGGDSDGAMTLTCQDADGTQIKIRTNKLYDANGTLITASAYEGKTINIRGIVETYMDDYQIDVFAAKDITVLN